MKLLKRPRAGTDPVKGRLTAMIKYSYENIVYLEYNKSHRSLVDTVHLYFSVVQTGISCENSVRGRSGPLPVPGLESIAGSLEQIALHDHTIRSIHVEFQLWVIVRKILQGEHTRTWSWSSLPLGVHWWSCQNDRHHHSAHIRSKQQIQYVSVRWCSGGVCVCVCEVHLNKKKYARVPVVLCVCSLTKVSI